METSAAKKSQAIVHGDPAHILAEASPSRWSRLVRPRRRVVSSLGWLWCELLAALSFYPSGDLRATRWLELLGLNELFKGGTSTARSSS
jgi:hypothetical protein